MKNDGKLPKKTTGKWVIFVFLDHVINSSSPVPCMVSGLVDRWDDTSVTIRYWHIISDDKEMQQNNKEVLEIVQGTFVKWDYVNPSWKIVKEI